MVLRSRFSHVLASLAGVGSSRLGAVALVSAATMTTTPLLLAGQGQDDSQEELRAEGERLYETGCSGCHGEQGEGVVTGTGRIQGPPLSQAGEASAYFYLSTGRMPMGSTAQQPQRKPRAYDEEQIAALVAYVASLGDGPAMPEISSDAPVDLARGGEIYQQNCQACHGASGSGGALSYGRAAPALAPATIRETAAAVRAGPGQMPVFGPEVITDGELEDLLAYVDYLDHPEDPGGFPLGRVGPMPEGFIAWMVGLGALLALIVWIGTRSPLGPEDRAVDGAGGADARGDEKESR